MHTYNELCDTWSSQDEVHIHDVKMTGDLPGSGRQHVYIYIYIYIALMLQQKTQIHHR